MKIEKLALLFVLCLFYSFTSNAQDWRIGTNFNIGIENFNYEPNWKSDIFTEEFRPYYSLGALSQFFFYEGYFAEAGLNLNYSHRKYQFDITDPMGFGLELVRLKVNRHTYYLSAPVSLGCKVKWFSLKVGLQFTHATIIDDSRNERLDKLWGEPEFNKLNWVEDDFQRFYVESVFQIAARIQQDLDLQLSLIHNGQSEDYRSLFPKYRYALGIIYFL